MAMVAVPVYELLKHAPAAYYLGESVSAYQVIQLQSYLGRTSFQAW